MSKPMKIKDVSAVICAKNESDRITRCLQSLRSIGIKEIIVVDGSSNDQTAEIASSYANVVLQDSGTGIGAARNLGIMAATKSLILNFGIDNHIDPQNLQIMIDEIASGKYLGVTAKQRVRGFDYLSRCLNLYKTARFTVGERSVIGTPSLFTRERLISYMFDDACVYSDDAELCERMIKTEQGTFYISEALVYEFGENSLKAMKRRWLLYGKSDSEIYTKHKYAWTLPRKIKSILHPLRNELIQPFKFHGIKFGLYILPFLIIITFYRYQGWLRAIRK